MKQQTNQSSIEWKLIPLEDLAESISAGGTPRRDKIEYWKNGSIPWLKISDMKDKYISETEETITEEGLKMSSTRIFPKGTIVYSIFATLGAIGILERELTTNQAIAGIIPKKELILTKYLYYCLISERNRIIAKGSHATQDNLNLTILRNHKIPVPFRKGKPDLETQQKIVAILEKAEKLKEQGKKTEVLFNEYLKSVFNEMFLNKGFKIKGFLDVFNITTGKLDSNAMEKEGKYPFFTCSQETYKINSYAFDCEALLLSGNNAAGRYSVKYYLGKFNAYQRTYILTLKEKGDYRYVHFVLTNKLEELQRKSIGTNTKYLTLGILKSLKIPIPTVELQQKFASIVEHVEKLKEIQKQENERLNKIFDSLMQNAFRGELIK